MNGFQCVKHESDAYRDVLLSISDSQLLHGPIHLFIHQSIHSSIHGDPTQVGLHPDHKGASSGVDNYNQP